MFHPDVQAALAKERRDTLLAKAADARLARQARERRRRRRVSPPREVRWAAPAAGLLRNLRACLVRREADTLQCEIALVPASEEHDLDRDALIPR
jgi:hypothetical protein